VLEIGTGSGYSTALLCTLVGEEGSVISLDIDQEMVERASALLRQDGFINAQVLCADGRFGYPAGAPYERLVAWAAAENRIPAAWREQVIAGGLIVAPRQDGRVLKVRLTAEHTTAEEAVIEAGFIPLTAKPFKPWESD
jgi:protein-L-isoaspartate(D-aspartate) O-methyltransferase